ncbi:hypothetical protein AC249_AIPGENE7340 [Exaiptasia diaphana]|nr:hypothetical protein AC249_AIPGENE7340 [Exaiptasia diaphana]
MLSMEEWEQVCITRHQPTRSASKECVTYFACNSYHILDGRQLFYPKKESPIRADTAYGYFCVQPKSGDCNPTQDTVSWNHGLEWKSADKYCSAEHMKFLFDASGRIYHKCSGKIVCEQDLGSKYPPINQRLILTNSCPDEIAKHKRQKKITEAERFLLSCFNLFLFTKFEYSIFYDNVSAREGRKLVYLDGCDGNRLALEFFKLRFRKRENMISLGFALFIVSGEGQGI